MAFAYKRSVTIDHTKCGSSDSSNFPVLVKISDATFKTVGNGGHIQNSSGYDIAFYSDSGLTTSLFWEIDYYDGTNGVLWAWVKVSTVSHTSDTVIYVGYGDSGISTFQSTASSVWDSNFKVVNHFGDGSTLSLGDSTSNANNGTNSNVTAATGVIGGAGSFNGSNTDITVPTISLTNVTAQAWVYSSNFNQNGMFVMKSPVNGEWALFEETTNTIFRGDSTGGVGIPSALSNNNWHLVVGTANGTAFCIYIDGVLQTAHADTAPPNSTGAIHIGNFDNSGYYFNGLIDEVRVSNVARSADWITTEYNNQNSPSTFLTIGSETSLGTASLIARLFGYFQSINRSNTY